MEIKVGHTTTSSVDVADKCLPRVSVLLRSDLRALDFSMSVDVVSSSHLRRLVGRTPCSLFHIHAAFSPHSLFPVLQSGRAAGKGMAPHGISFHPVTHRALREHLGGSTALHHFHPHF